MPRPRRPISICLECGRGGVSWTLSAQRAHSSFFERASPIAHDARSEPIALVLEQDAEVHALSVTGRELPVVHPAEHLEQEDAQ